MAYYDIDTAKFTKDNVPARKRLQFPVLERLINGLLVGFTRAVSIFKKYKEGYTTNWTAGTYNYGDIVAWNGAVYECFINGTTSQPNDSTSWRMLFTMYRGTNEAQKYNGTVMQLEYAMNRYWGLTHSPTPMASSIYIVTNIIPDPVFAVGTESTNTATVGLATSDSFVPVNYATTIIPKSFTIYVPFVWYVNLSFYPDEKIGAFVNQYVTEGVTYNIQTY